MVHSAKFITFEGIDGAGKSTIIKQTQTYLQNQGIKVVVTREPGGTLVAEEIRRVLLSDEFINVCGETEALMMFAARFEHLREKIIPALEQDSWVLCDRFSDSTFAYQAYGRGVDVRFIEQLVHLVHPHHQPDVTFLLDIDTDTSFHRLSQKPAECNRFDTHINQFQENIRTGYLALAQKYPQRIKRIFANQSIEQVCKDVQHYLTPLMRSLH